MNEVAISYLTTAESVTLFWDKPDHVTERVRYEILLDNRPVGTSDRTHFTIPGLVPNTEHRIEVLIDGAVLGRCTVKTGPRLQRLNVRDFGAAGDGKVMDTIPLQRAIDACESGQEVYLPAGTYRTGALRLHSQMALFLDENAVLQGTDVPEDYLPRIHSRFEGTEMECYSSLLNLGELDHSSGSNCHDVLIYGKGIIASGGQVLASRIIAITSLSSAATTFAGQNFGAENDKRLRKGAWQIPLLSGIFTCAAGMLVAFPLCEPLLRLFNKDSDVLLYAVRYIHIVLPFTWAYAVFSGTISFANGLGEIRYPTVVNLLTLWAVRIPAGYLIDWFYDGTYCMVSIPISFVFGMISMSGFFLTKKWRGICSQ